MGNAASRVLVCRSITSMCCSSLILGMVPVMLFRARVMFKTRPYLLHIMPSQLQLSENGIINNEVRYGMSHWSNVVRESIRKDKRALLTDQFDHSASLRFDSRHVLLFHYIAL